MSAFTKSSEGIFLFNHISAGCGTTLGVKVTVFLEHFSGIEGLEEFDVGAAEGCKKLCLNPADLSRCGNPNCKGSIMRDVMQEVEISLERARYAKG